MAGLTAFLADRAFASRRPLGVPRNHPAAGDVRRCLCARPAICGRGFDCGRFSAITTLISSARWSRTYVRAGASRPNICKGIDERRLSRHVSERTGFLRRHASRMGPFSRDDVQGRALLSAEFSGRPAVTSLKVASSPAPKADHHRLSHLQATALTAVPAGADLFS